MTLKIQSCKKPNNPFKRLLKQRIILSAFQNSRMRRDRNLLVTFSWYCFVTNFFHVSVAFISIDELVCYIFMPMPYEMLHNHKLEQLYSLELCEGMTKNFSCRNFKIYLEILVSEPFKGISCLISSFVWVMQDSRAIDHKLK